MSDLISRQNAIALLEGIPDDTDGNGYEAGYNQAKRDCIEALTNMPSAESEWRPIETAPKDAMLLGYADGMVRLVLWEGGRWVQVGATIELGWFNPTHWMPLPEPPK